MRFYNYITEKTDTGEKGKYFEDILFKAFDLIDLDYKRSIGRRTLWDLKPIGDGWVKTLGSKNVNIKVSGSKWLFGTAKLGKLFPQEGKISSKEEKEELEKKIKNWILKNNIHDVYFMKPKDSTIQKEIVSAVQNMDKEKINELLVKKNFRFEKLGSKFSVELTIKDDNTIGYISVIKNNKQFMHSEKPRKVGGSSHFITFRTPKAEIGKKNKRVKKKT